ncbi:MAG: DCC1-like thiol-disulfide oxidoreductase family protein [Hyphomicrobiaceae bacterium]|nr:DCC1-like thiol-disulfide oxidoreductase family protein [Hyphomicrobiaceae bacterium]
MDESIQERLARLPAYAWRSDPAVPPFPDDRPLIVFDGVCVLCSGFARFVAARDRAGAFRFTAAQSPLGQGLYRHFGLDPVNYETNLLLAEGRAFAKLSAFAEIVSRLGWPWQAGAVVGLVPAWLGDSLYDPIARSRYRIFGQASTCHRPDATWRRRMIE